MTLPENDDDLTSWSLDGRYFFFIGHQNGLVHVYWIDEKVNEYFKPKKIEVKEETMKHKVISVAMLLSLMFVCSSYAQQYNFPALKGPYLGQKPPGMTPEIFAPGVISTCLEHSSAIFSNDGKEVYLCRYEKGYKRARIYCMREENGAWS